MKVRWFLDMVGWCSISVGLVVVVIIGVRFSVVSSVVVVMMEWEISIEVFVGGMMVF